MVVLVLAVKGSTKVQAIVNDVGVLVIVVDAISVGVVWVLDIPAMDMVSDNIVRVVLNVQVVEVTGFPRDIAKLN